MSYRLCALLLAGLGLSTGAACATGGDPIDTGRADGSRRRLDGGMSEDCVPACPEGAVCLAGRCVVPGDDGDGDGVLAEDDCDDTDATIGTRGDRACSSECGEGVEQCLDGVWLPCTAPSECTCRESDPPRVVPCSMCGMQRQVCTGGMWVDDGACTEGGECTPGDTMMGGGCGGMCGTERFTCTAECRWGHPECLGEGECIAGEITSEGEACGACGEGMRLRQRSCSTECRWGTFAPFGACETAAQCAPGETSSETGACGNCDLGRRTRTRSCDAATCMWGAWGAWGSCSGGGTCAPGDTRGGCDVNSAGAATSCGHQVCSGSCTWGGCTLTPGSACLSDRGTNYSCCTPSGGGAGWRFCNASTCQWFGCASHSC